MNRSINPFALRLLVCLVTLGPIAAPGCGGDEGERRYKVAGIVTYKGESLAHGEIIFTPLDLAKGQAASSPIENGSFSLGTLAEADGALPGQYKVAVTSTDVDLTQVKAAPGKGRPSPKELAKANRNAKSLVPKKYESSQTSPLTAEVKPQSNSISFELTD